MRLSKIIFVAVIMLCTVALWYIISVMAFNGVFDKKYTREELVENFKETERDFEELEKQFLSILPKEKKKITFGVKGDNVSLNIYPEVITAESKIIGADDVDVDSPQLLQVLDSL